MFFVMELVWTVSLRKYVINELTDFCQLIVIMLAVWIGVAFAFIFYSPLPQMLRCYLPPYVEMRKES